MEGWKKGAVNRTIVCLILFLLLYLSVTPSSSARVWDEFNHQNCLDLNIPSTVCDECLVRNVTLETCYNIAYKISNCLKLYHNESLRRSLHINEFDREICDVKHTLDNFEKLQERLLEIEESRVVTEEKDVEEFRMNQSENVGCYYYTHVDEVPGGLPDGGTLVGYDERVKFHPEIEAVIERIKNSYGESIATDLHLILRDNCIKLKLEEHLKIAKDFEDELKKEGVRVEITKATIFPQEKIIEATVDIKSNYRRLEWHLGPTIKDGSLIDLQDEKIPVSKLLNRDSNELFQRLFLVSKNITPIIKTVGGAGEIRIWKDLTSGKLFLKSNEAVAEIVIGLSLDETGLYIEQGKRVNLIPDIVTSIDDIEIKEIEEDLSSSPYYDVKGTKKGKILGIIPVKIDVVAKISAISGEIQSLEKPWWSFLVW